MAHQASLSWTASTDAVTGYNVYRSSAANQKTTLLTPTPITAVTFTDTTVAAGSWFYDVTAVANGVESPISNSVNAVIPPAPPTNLVVVSDN